jgi:hypothetical protein
MVHHHHYKSLKLVCIINHFNTIHIFAIYFFKILSNITLPSCPRSQMLLSIRSAWPLPALEMMQFVTAVWALMKWTPLIQTVEDHGKFVQNVPPCFKMNTLYKIPTNFYKEFNNRNASSMSS